MNTFALFEDRGIGTKLGIAPLAGGLFSQDALGPLTGCRLNNHRLLESLRGLSQFTDKDTGTVQVVNYASLDVEEFGSVYEGLLEYDPAIDLKARSFTFVKGQDRSSSGSHYTPDELVQPLIKHSLEHLIADRTVAPDAPEDKRQTARQKLLKLKVADVACGSGHILLAAARRIGLELARLASGAEQPSPPEIRQGTRDAIRNCIYGVDKNPLAVELCQVALWLEAHQPGQPLNFLEHRIRCGDAIVGVGRLEDLRKGIPTEAFKNYPGDSDEAKENGKLLRKRNKEERKVREAGGGSLSLFNQLDTVEDQLAAFQKKYDDFATLPETTPAEIEAKANAYQKLTTGSNWWFIKTLADVQTAQFFLGLGNETKVVTDATYFEMLGGAHRQSQAAAAATGASAERRFFHWFLEFPEVFAGGGFDCVVGNPPFLGGQKISTAAGREYLGYIHNNYVPAKGTTDLVAYFFRRIFNVLAKGGFQSLISTNTIAQGDTREGGLAAIKNMGGTINHAVRSMRWPGVAAVEVALVTIFKGKWQQPLVLNDAEVEQITTYLDDQEFLGDPFRLEQNAGKSFVGSYVLGKGFVLEPEQAVALIEKNPKNKDVLFPYLNGSDLNSRPDQSPSRWVINFFDWPERRLTVDEWKTLTPDERDAIRQRITAGKTVEVAPPGYNQPVATDYPDCYGIVEREVKPERQRWKVNKKTGNEIEGEYALRRPLPERWWMYGEKRPALYRTIAGMERVLSIALTSKTVGFAFMPTDIVWSHATGVIGLKRTSEFAVLQSSYHYYWAWKYGSSMKNDLRYTPSDVFDTFPLPTILTDVTEKTGSEYESTRSALCRDLLLGLTKVYGAIGNPHLLADYDDLWENDVLTDPQKLKARKQSKETYNLWSHLDRTEGTIGMGEAVARIVELRRLHKEMDEAVLAAYGWHVTTRRWGPAIRLRHDFYEVDYLPEKDNVRYTIHPDARREVLKRLLLLNHEIHEAEERGVDYAVVDGEKVTALLREQLEAWLPGGSEKLHWKTLKFLCTGEDLLPNLERSLTKSYKPFVTAYASGLEAELQHKIFIAWNEEFQSRWKVEDGSLKVYLDQQKALDPKKRRMDNFARKLERSVLKYTLGEMQFILQWVATGSTIKKSSLLQDFRTFVVSLYGEAVLEKDFLARMDSFVKTYRNEAAHTGEVDKTMAEGCRDEVRDMVKVLVENEQG
ncbi:restriction endonuclease [Neolewinella aurantiaca]|uniref:site-specific DNA-methyltransferase (adenine-specific) n=1 Tax=Neolewinella aurantiaca TaxID=2602767 RepID=A0A5C7FCR4_9BACT|nr:DNA methyltransferase [Neolewinella aurantiaca]TXF82284.1 restriction endonuclease [Neolewinella aurantiaca]